MLYLTCMNSICSVGIFVDSCMLALISRLELFSQAISFTSRVALNAHLHNATMHTPQQSSCRRELHRDAHAVSRLPSFNSFYGSKKISLCPEAFLRIEYEPTKAFIVPCRACLWFRRNFGSVPLRDGYLEVFGFLILDLAQRSTKSAYRIVALRFIGFTYPLR